jgi:hypothetical protein
MVVQPLYLFPQEGGLHAFLSSIWSHDFREIGG